MFRYTALALASLTAFAISCDDDPPKAAYPPANPELIAYLSSQFGTSVDLFVVGELSDAYTDGELTVTVEGFGTRTLRMEEIVSPLTEGGGVLLHLEDTETGDTRFFDYDRSENSITFGRDLLEPDAPGFKERGVTVHQREDGKYVVWAFDDDARREMEQVVDDGYQALQTVNEYNEFNSIPPHIMMTAIAVGHASVPEVRQFVDIRSEMVAATPPVCTVFKAFCDCAACTVLARDGDSCDLCPQL